MAELLSSRGCRVADLELALGWPSSGVCGSCDRCRRETPSASPPKADIVLALDALAGVPFSMRRGAVHRVVAEALKDAGRSAERSRVATVVDDLLARHLLEPLAGNLGSVLGISGEGRMALALWDRLQMGSEDDWMREPGSDEAARDGKDSGRIEPA
jgi:hypothetical protein